MDISKEEDTIRRREKLDYKSVKIMVFWDVHIAV